MPPIPYPLSHPPAACTEGPPTGSAPSLPTRSSPLPPSRLKAPWQCIQAPNAVVFFMYLSAPNKFYAVGWGLPEHPRIHYSYIEGCILNYLHLFQRFNLQKKENQNVYVLNPQRRAPLMTARKIDPGSNLCWSAASRPSKWRPPKAVSYKPHQAVPSMRTWDTHMALFFCCAVLFVFLQRSVFFPDQPPTTRLGSPLWRPTTTYRFPLFILCNRYLIVC